jgi:polyketide synthase 12/myxalamid-type polyketide synthase MxaB
LPPDQALEHLGALLSAESPAQVGVFAADWKTLAAAAPGLAASPLLKGIAPAWAGAMPAEASEKSAFLEALAAALPENRLGLIRAAAEDVVRRILRLEPGDRLDAKAPFLDLGVDSLMAVELRNLFGKMLGKVLPATVIFNYPNLDALVGFLAEESGCRAEPPREAAAQKETGVDDLLDDLDRLSDVEAEALLSQANPQEGTVRG